MKESFDEYKQTIESNLINFTYLYDGDVISSNHIKYSKNIESTVNNNSISPLFIIDSFDYVYAKSFENLIKKSEEISIQFDFSMDELNINDILAMVDKLEIKALYVFCSIKLKSKITERFSSGPFPLYFYSIKNIHDKNYDLYYSPFIKEDKDEIVLYVTDKSIQSLVYSIQNMNYYIETFDGNIKKHTLDIPIYDCDFKSYKVSIKNISKIRNERIESILT